MNRPPVELSTRRNFHPARKEAGAVAIIVALSLVALVGFVGLALDLGKLFVAKTELQNSADACALAAARELTGANTNQLKLAEAAGIATGERHDVLFQDEPIKISSVTFSQTLTGSYQAAFPGPGATAMRFARCEASKAGIANWFIQVLNLLPGTAIGDQTVAASAVATLTPSQITSCAIPVAVCSKDVPPTTPVGKWLEGVLENDKNITGSFKWVDFTPPAGGAKEVGENLTGPGVCNLPATGTEVGESGYKASLAADWNSRFGIYFGDVKDGDVSEGIGIPDFSGYAYTEMSWPTKSNAFPDFRNRRGSTTSYQGNVNTGLETKGSIKDSTYLKMHGIDRRLATVAVVDCDGFISGSTAPVTEWACILMLHPINNDASGSGVRMYLEYLGRSNQANSPCATNGVPAGPTAAGPMVPALVR
jgi:hypothetical protein